MQKWVIPEKSKQGGWRHTFVKTPLEFFIFLIYPWKFQTKRAQPLEILQIFIRSFGNSKVKNQDHWKFHIIFYWSPLEISLCFLLTLGNSTCYFFDNHGIFISPTTPPPRPYFVFFWNSPLHRKVHKSLKSNTTITITTSSSVVQICFSSITSNIFLETQIEFLGLVCGRKYDSKHWRR